MKLGITLLSVCLYSATAIPVAAAETAMLRNGYSIQFDRRELRGEWTRLYLSASPSDFVDVRTDEITGFEAEGMAPIPPREPTPRANPLNAQDIDEGVSAASTRNNIPVNLIKSVISVESGARYLRDLLGLFHNDVPKALAAYNAGPERVEQYHGVPPYPETVAYVSRVIRNLNQRSGRSQQPFGAGVTDRSVGQSQKGARSARRKAGALFEASEVGPERDFERHPLSIN